MQPRHPRERGDIVRVGLVSDTHGLLRPEATEFLQGSDHIVHAGDICDPRILDELSQLAPVTPVRGNCDHGDWAERLCETGIVQVGEILVYVIHDLSQLGIDPAGAGVHVVVHGHSHAPCVERRDGVLYVNPGSSGPRRFRLPIAAGELIVQGASVSARVVGLHEPDAGVVLAA